MTSTKVSNIAVPVLPQSNGKVDTRVPEDGGVAFQNLLKSPRQGAEQKYPEKAERSNADDASGSAGSGSSFDTPSKKDAVRIEEAQGKRELTGEKAAEAEEAVKEFGEQVTKVLQEELGVSEEEIISAMETLGLNFLDLFDRANLMQLVGVLSGAEETVSLLTNQNLNGIMDQVSELVTNLTEETGIPAEELKALGMTELDKPLAEENDFAGVFDAAKDAAAAPEAPPGAPDLPKTEGESVLSAPGRAGTEEPLPMAEEETAPTETIRAETAPARETEQREEVTQETPEEKVILSEPVRTEAPKEELTGEGEQKGFAGGEWKETENAGKEQADFTPEPQHTAPQEVQQKAPEAAPVQEQAAPERPIVDPRDLMEQFTEFARTNITADTSEIEMRLNPESLGRLLIHVTEHEGNVRATIQTASAEVKEALEGQLAILRTTLEAQGTRVTEVEVTVASHEFEENLEQGNGPDFGQEENAEGRSAEEEHRTSGRRNLNINDPDSLAGDLSEEEALAARIMRENGNSVDFTA